MKSDSKLEWYLTSLELVLRPFPVSDRAEIVTEIKSHVLSALERDSAMTIESVLNALGAPETVANRYLIERGLKPTKPSISPIVKWLVIGVMGTFAMLMIFLGVLVTKFSPLVHVDDLNDHVSLLGGMIQVDGKKGEVSIDAWLRNGVRRTFKGSEEVKKGQKIVVNFLNGKISLSSSKSSLLSWNCNSTATEGQNSAPVIASESITFNYNQFSGIKCEISIPEKAKIQVKGNNGKVELSKPHSPVDVDLNNGKVEIAPDSKAEYKFSLSVQNGKIDDFESSQKIDSIPISVRINNGKIEKED